MLGSARWKLVSPSTPCMERKRRLVDACRHLQEDGSSRTSVPVLWPRASPELLPTSVRNIPKGSVPCCPRLSAPHMRSTTPSPMSSFGYSTVLSIYLNGESFVASYLDSFWSRSLATLSAYFSTPVRDTFAETRGNYFCVTGHEGHATARYRTRGDDSSCRTMGHKTRSNWVRPQDG